MDIEQEVERAIKKMKIIFLVEFLIFVVVFIVLGILEILHIIGNKEVMHTVFNWVTIFGGTWMLVDFFWTLFSKKRRLKNSVLDKALIVPAGIYLITFDIMCFCKLSFIDTAFRQLMIGILFFYFAAVYLFQAIYHWFVPLPALANSRKDFEEQIRAEMEKEQAAQIEEPKPANDPNIIDAEVEPVKEDKEKED